MATLSSIKYRSKGQAYIEFLITFTVFIIFVWSILGLAKIMDLEYSTQQARRFMAWQDEVIGAQAGIGATAADAERIESLFFEHPLAGYGYAAGNAPASQTNTLWEDPSPDNPTTLPATLKFETEAITLGANRRTLANSSIVNGGDNAVFLGSPFATPANYDNQTVTVNLSQVPYLMEDATASINPRMLDQSRTVRTNPSASGGVYSETLLPADEAELVDNIAPTPNAAQMAATEFWLSVTGAFTQFTEGLGFDLNFDLGFIVININLTVDSYPFDELTTVPADEFFDIKAPEQSNILPSNRLEPL